MAWGADEHADDGADIKCNNGRLRVVGNKIKKVEVVIGSWLPSLQSTTLPSKMVHSA